MMCFHCREMELDPHHLGKLPFGRCADSKGTCSKEREAGQGKELGQQAHMHFA